MKFNQYIKKEPIIKGIRFDNDYKTYSFIMDTLGRVHNEEKFEREKVSGIVFRHPHFGIQYLFLGNYFCKDIDKHYISLDEDYMSAMYNGVSIIKK